MLEFHTVENKRRSRRTAWKTTTNTNPLPLLYRKRYAYSEARKCEEIPSRGVSVDDPLDTWCPVGQERRERAKEARERQVESRCIYIYIYLSLLGVPTLPFKRRKSIMLRTLDIFSMIVIVGQPCLAAPRAWQPHYSARGATVAAVASIRLSSDLPRLRLPVASLIVAFHPVEQDGYTPLWWKASLSRDAGKLNPWPELDSWTDSYHDRQRLINMAVSCLFTDTLEIRKILI